MGDPKKIARAAKKNKGMKVGRKTGTAGVGGYTAYKGAKPASKKSKTTSTATKTVGPPKFRSTNSSTGREARSAAPATKKKVGKLGSKR